MPDNLSSSEPIYYIDRVNLLFRYDLKRMHSIINVNTLKVHTRALRFKKPNEAAKRNGYQSELVATVPKAELFKELSELLRRTYHIIISVEITRDMFYQSESDTIKRHGAALKKLRKKYSNKVTIVDSSKKTKKESPYDDELYDMETLSENGNATARRSNN